MWKSEVCSLSTMWILRTECRFGLSRTKHLDLLSHLTSPKLQLEKNHMLYAERQYNQKTSLNSDSKKKNYCEESGWQAASQYYKTKKLNKDTGKHQKHLEHVIHRDYKANHQKAKRWAVLQDSNKKTKKKSCLESQCWQLRTHKRHSLKCAQHKTPINGRAISKCCRCKSSLPYTQQRQQCSSDGHLCVKMHLLGRAQHQHTPSRM